MWRAAHVWSGIVCLVLGSCAPGNPDGRTDQDLHRLDFELEVQNLSLPRRAFTERPPVALEICPDLAGELRYGEIPHRQAGEPLTSTENFLFFVAAYGDEGTVDAALLTVLIDANRDRRLDCDEQVPLVPHPDRPGLAFRTLTLPGGGQGSVSPDRRFRLTLPTALAGDPAVDQYSLDLVDVLVARWNVDGRETLWILFDGNFDNRFDARFGDGLLVDVTGERRISTNPRGENFFSLHLPLGLPWGTYEVRELDPGGRFLTLERTGDADPEVLAPLRPGSVTEAFDCRDGAGGTVRIGGATGRHQLLYFWLSHCGSCQADLEELPAVLERLGGERPVVVGVSLDEQEESFRGFAGRHRGVGSHCFLGTSLWDNAIARRFGIVAPSDFVLLDPEGVIVFKDRGLDVLERKLAEALSTQP